MQFCVLAGNNNLTTSISLPENIAINTVSNVPAKKLGRGEAKKQAEIQAKAADRERKDEIAAQVRASLAQRKMEKELEEQAIRDKTKKKMKSVAEKCRDLEEALKEEKASNYELKCKLVASEKRLLESSVQKVTVSTELSMKKKEKQRA